MTKVGISGFAAYLPPYRVDLEDWCAWTDSSWGKIRESVGHGFRMRGHHQNVYTMAANAVLRLILTYEVDPRKVGFLGFGTESSTDNSAGAIIIKGIVDQGLRQLGLPELSRHCEVPEVKHACLGGVYAMKAAGRFLAWDGHDQQAIVVSADIAEYERGSTGEPTQGAGAIAMLMEANPSILTLDLRNSGNSADYRGADFRKPFARFALQKATTNAQLRDFPVFNGFYSTNCYIDAMLVALEHMFTKRKLDRAEYFRSINAVFLHRPYSRMPEMGWAIGYLCALAHGSEADLDELEAYCASAEVELADLCEEFDQVREFYSILERGSYNTPLFPKIMQVVRVLRKFDSYQPVASKQRLGWDGMKECGNLYTASLFAWLAAGLEQAMTEDLSLDHAELLAIGYGSGDAAEAIPMHVVPGWQAAVAKIGFADSFSSDANVNLNQSQYGALHSGINPVDLPILTEGEFFISRVGKEQSQEFDEYGLDYYGYTPAEEKIQEQVQISVQRSRRRRVSRGKG